MRIAAIEDAIGVCRHHLDTTSSRNTEVDAFLTRYLVVMICATFEEQLEALVFERANRVGDSDVSSFVKSATGNLLRSIRISELSGFLNRFGTAYKESFQQEVQKDNESQLAYDTIIVNRHGTAHGSGTMITFDELEKLYPKSVTVLDAFASALGVASNP